MTGLYVLRTEKKRIQSVIMPGRHGYHHETRPQDTTLKPLAENPSVESKAVRRRRKHLFECDEHHFSLVANKTVNWAHFGLLIHMVRKSAFEHTEASPAGFVLRVALRKIGYFRRRGRRAPISATTERPSIMIMPNMITPHETWSWSWLGSVDSLIPRFGGRSAIDGRRTRRTAVAR